MEEGPARNYCDSVPSDRHSSLHTLLESPGWPVSTNFFIPRISAHLGRHLRGPVPMGPEIATGCLPPLSCRIRQPYQRKTGGSKESRNFAKRIDSQRTGKILFVCAWSKKTLIRPAAFRSFLPRGLVLSVVV